MPLGAAEVAHGPLLIGLTVNVLLYGIMLVQSYLYVKTYFKDPLWIRCYVWVLLLVDTLNTGFLFVYLYNSVIRCFADDTALTTANWVFATDPAMTAIIGSMVQLFFAWRISVLRVRHWVVFFTISCAIIGFLAGTSTSVAIGFVPEFSLFQRFRAAVIVWLLSAACGDIVITWTMVNYLRDHRTGYAATDDRIEQIIRLTIQTGMLTAVWSIVDLCVYLGDPTGMHLAFNLPLSKLYSNSLMSSLNARGGWRDVDPPGNEAAPSQSQCFREIHVPDSMDKSDPDDFVGTGVLTTFCAEKPEHAPEP
ncbi:hypothetical protein C8J56DRAFT_980396 [Mycena floridula]|nr:hypothetical protein C8J56DRAFT_980396 [Mycena floridula]